jgi:hypothetical protein
MSEIIIGFGVLVSMICSGVILMLLFAAAEDGKPPR